MGNGKEEKRQSNLSLADQARFYAKKGDLDSVNRCFDMMRARGKKVSRELLWETRFLGHGKKAEDNVLLAAVFKANEQVSDKGGSLQTNMTETERGFKLEQRQQRIGKALKEIIDQEAELMAEEHNDKVED